MTATRVCHRTICLVCWVSFRYSVVCASIYGAFCGLNLQATFRTSGNDVGNIGTLLHGIIE